MEKFTIDLSSVLDEDGGEYLGGIRSWKKHTSSVNQIMSYYVKIVCSRVFRKIMMDHWQL